jgi:hypothetical protein
MIFAQIAYFALAFGMATQALLLLHRGIPRVIDARGHWQAYCHCILAFVLILGFQPWLERGLHGAPLNGWSAGRDALLLLYAFCRYRRAIGMSETTWSRQT